MLTSALPESDVWNEALAETGMDGVVVGRNGVVVEGAAEVVVNGRCVEDKVGTMTEVLVVMLVVRSCVVVVSIGMELIVVERTGGRTLVVGNW